MKTTHTQGPWRYEASTKTIRSEPTNYWLATMDSWDGAVNHEANACLIAAAPLMQDELTLSHAALDSVLTWAHISDTHRSMITERINAIERTLAKARGE
jgi:hypothetical protein